MKIPEGLSESVYQRTDNTMVKRKSTKGKKNQRSTKHTYKTKDGVTRTVPNVWYFVCLFFILLSPTAFIWTYQWEHYNYHMFIIMSILHLLLKTRIWMTKLRAWNLRIPIETGRWYTIPKDERVCTLCGQSIGDVFHLLFGCCNEYLVNLRRIYLPRYYGTYPSIVKMNGLLSFCNVAVY